MAVFKLYAELIFSRCIKNPQGIDMSDIEVVPACFQKRFIR